LSPVITTALPTPWAEDVEAHMAEEEHTKEEAAVQTQDMVVLGTTVAEAVVVATMKMSPFVKFVARGTTML
jgi:hypothetical protein